MRTGTANLPLHYGNAPRWLFERMVKLAREITILTVEEYSPQEFLKRLSSPYWFQALGCTLGFDWHSSGLTTTVCGALKEAVRGLETDLGLFIAGGKGKTSRKTPEEIERWGELGALVKNPKELIYASRMSAKVDSAALQDGYTLYHHTFFFTKEGEWATVQQGMNTQSRWARRYHWLKSNVKELVVEPHQAICCDHTSPSLNMTAKESEEARAISSELAQAPNEVAGDLEKLKKLSLPLRHPIYFEDLNPQSIKKILLKSYEAKPKNFEELLGLRGVGAKTIRALALISELVYGKAPSYKDPVKFSFAHGGKDGYPYPIDKEDYDKSIEILRKATSKARIGQSEKLKAFKRLAKYSC